MQIVFPSFIVYEDIIKIYNHGRIYEWPQDIIHCPNDFFGASVKPKGMTNHSKRPFLELKTIFHTLVYSIGT
jgi:hypothetical protein